MRGIALPKSHSSVALLLSCDIATMAIGQVVTGCQWASVGMATLAPDYRRTPFTAASGMSYAAPRVAYKAAYHPPLTHMPRADQRKAPTAQGWQVAMRGHRCRRCPFVEVERMEPLTECLAPAERRKDAGDMRTSNNVSGRLLGLRY